jgi:hypothetical protein
MSASFAGVIRSGAALALALLLGSCMTPPVLALGSPMDLDPGNGLTATIELREDLEAYLLDMKLTGSVARNFDVAAEIVMDDGTTLKGGAPEKTHPDWVDTGTMRRGVLIRIPKGDHPRRHGGVVGPADGKSVTSARCPPSTSSAAPSFLS